MSVTRIEQNGDQLAVFTRDGRVTMAVPTGTGQWLMSGGSGSTNPEPPDTGGGDPGEGGTSSTGINVTASMVQTAVTSVGGSVSAMVATPQKIADMFNSAIARAMPGVLLNKKRAACLVGECAQETDWFKTTKEYGGESTRYAPYYGRGFIQLTWENNYRNFGAWLKGKGIVSDSNSFVRDPDDLASLQWAAYTALFYFGGGNPAAPIKWNGKNLFEWCDSASSPWSSISRAINRGDPEASSPAYGEAIRAQSINAVLGVTPDPVTPPTSDARMTAMIADMKSYYGKLGYSQAASLRSNPPGGYADCSGLVWWLYRKHYGINVGSWTGDQQNYGRVITTLTSTSAGLNEATMKPGDLVFFDWASNGNTPAWDHVEMYLGAGRMAGHGGNPYYGPVEKDMQSRVRSALRVRVRRYV